MNRSKKILSALLAVVMVALMIPAAAFSGSAANTEVSAGQVIHETDFTKLAPDDGTDGDVNSTELAGAGYVATTDSDTKVYTSLSSEKGFTIGGAEQALAMTQRLINSTENYVFEFTWDTTHKFYALDFAWMSTAPAAGSISFPSNYFRIVGAAGPSNKGGKANYTRNLSYGGTAWVDSNGSAISDITDTAGFWDKLVASEDFKVSMTITKGVVAEVKLTSGSTEIANFYPPSGAGVTASGYFVVRISGWAGNNSANIRNIKVTRTSGGLANDGVLQYTDFTVGFENSGTSGDINSSLPAGYVVTKDNVVTSGNEDVTRTSISTANGVLLGGASGSNSGDDTQNKTLGATEAFIEATGSYLVEFTWNTTHKLANLEWGWSEAAPTASTIGDNFPSEYFQLGVKAGPNNLGNTDSITLSGAGSAWLDAPGGSSGINLNSSLKPLVRTSENIDVSMVVENGEVTQVTLSGGGSEIETFYAPEGKTVTATGYLQIRITGWANNNSVNIKRIVVRATDNGDTENAGNLLHKIDFSKVTDIDATPYGIVTDSSINGYVELRHGALWQGFKSMDAVVSGCTNGFLLKKDLIGNPDTFTLEFDIAAGSASRILFVSFSEGFNDTNAFKLRFGDTFQSDSMYVPAGAGFTSSVTKEMNEKGFTVRLVVLENKLSRAIITLESGSSVSLYPTRVISAPTADLYFSQNAQKSFTGSYGVENIKITDAAAYTAVLDPEDVEAKLVPSDVAVIKANGAVSVIAPSSVSVGTYLSGTKWIKENGTYTTPPTGFVSKFTVEGGKIYAFLNADSANNIALVSEGTDMRLASNPGIRFKTEAARAQIDDIVKLAEVSLVNDVYYGTLITTRAHAYSAGAITPEALDALAERTGKSVYLDMDTEGFYNGTENIFAGSVVSITDYHREYVAVGYAKITLQGGATKTIYSDFISVSLADIAKDIAAGGYVGYTAAQKEAIEYILDTTVPAYTGSGTVNHKKGFELTGSRYDIIDNATETDFYDYTAKLAEEGYTRYQSNPVNGQLFEIWTDNYNIITVSHISYTDRVTSDSTYKNADNYLGHSSAYSGQGTMTYMSIAYDTIENSALPEMTTTSKVVTTEQLTTVGTSLAYVIRLSDGRFVVIDGEFSSNAANIYNTIVEQNVLPGKPVIAAWLLTHPHNDHYEAVDRFVQTYSDQVIIESFIANLPGYDQYYGLNYAERGSSGTDHYTVADNMKQYCTYYYNHVTQNYPNADFIIAHAGQKFVFGTMELDVLYTSENIYKRNMVDTNMSSVAYSIKGNGGRMIILGDSVGNACSQIGAIYGSSLKTDIVQVAHHGYNNGDTQMYSYMDATYAIWTNSLEKVQSDSLHTGSRNQFDYTSVVSNLIPSTSGSSIIITENTTADQMKALDAI